MMPDEGPYTPDIPWENRVPVEPLSAEELSQLSSLLDEIRDQFANRRLHSFNRREIYVSRLEELIQHHPLLPQDYYLSWVSTPLYYLHWYNPMFTDTEGDEVELTLAIDLELSFNLYARAAMYTRQFDRYRYVWGDVGRIHREKFDIEDDDGRIREEKFTIGEEGRGIYLRFRELFRPHPHLMRRLALIKWLDPYNTPVNSPQQIARNTSPRYYPRV